MGEPLQVLESSDSEISRLFPKCRPRFVLSNPAPTTETDLNLNSVHGTNDNDNYKLPQVQTLPATYDEEVTSQDSSVSRMSVDTVSATSSSSNTHSSSHSSVSSPSSRSGHTGKSEPDVDLTSASAYRNYEETQPSVHDSSYEEPHANHRHPSLVESGVQPMPAVRRDNHRLRDSRIEAAGGREVFSQSRSRQVRRRHDDSRRMHPSHHHYHHHHHPLNHHSSHHPPQAAPRRHQLAMNERRGTSSSRSESSSSRSTSTNSSLGDQTSEGATGCTTEKDKNVSVIPYASGSNEAAFDDINEWVTRGLSVRGMANDRKDNLPTCDSFSQSEHETDTDPDMNVDPVKKIGNVPIAEYEGSPRRYGPRSATRHHSPRSVHLMPQMQRTPKPGFPRRITSNEDRRNKDSLSVSSTSPMWDKQGGSSREKFHSNKERSHHREKKTSSSKDKSVESHRDRNRPKELSSSKLHEESLSKLSNYSVCLDPSLVQEPIVSKNFHASRGTEKENDLCFLDQPVQKQEECVVPEKINDISPGSLPVISISTLSSLYGPVLHKHNSQDSNKGYDLEAAGGSEAQTADYDFEISETRKVLQDFFRDVEPKLTKQEFSDLEYTLKRQQGNSYVGQRLAEDLKELGDCDMLHNTMDSSVPTSNGLERHTMEGHNSQEDLENGTARNLTMSPASSSCDSAGDESEYSVDVEGSVHSSLKGVCPTMPVLEDGLSSGEESDSGVVKSQKNDQDPSFVPQFLEELVGSHVAQSVQQIDVTDQHRHQEEIRLYQQRTRSFDDQLCRGELPSFRTSRSMTIPDQHFLQHADSTEEESFVQRRSHMNSNYDRTHSPSSSTLTLMKKQITEIEREIALKKPDGQGRRSETENGHANLDLHLLDPLSEKLCEPPPPPAPHPHREDGEDKASPPPSSSVNSSILHSPQITPAPCGISAPQLLSSIGSLSSPIATHIPPSNHQPEQQKTGVSVSPSRESVEAAIADIKQAIRRTKNMSLKAHSHERHQDRGPVWIPRSRREGPHSEQSTPTSPQQSHLSPDQQSSPSVDGTRSQDRSLHEDDGDTDQETDRLLGQQRSDETGFIEEKSWRRSKKKPVLPRYLSPKDTGSGDATPDNSNESTQSTPVMQSHLRSPGQSPPSPQDNAKNKNKKEKESNKKKGRSKEVMIHEPAVLIEGVLFRARYLGSTQLVSEGQPTKTTRMMQAEEAVSRIKALAPEGEPQPSTEVDLFISTEKIMVLNTDLKEIMMDHALRTISYIADIGDLVVLMARRRVLPTDEPGPDGVHKTPKMICHVFESDEAQFIAQSIGQAFQVAYLEFLKANGIEDHSFVKEMDYQEVLNSQEIFGDELQMFAKKELQKEVVVPKLKGDILGVVVVESGWGSMVPTVVIANLSPVGAAAKCGQLNIGDQIIAINGVSLVGLPLSTCQNYIKNTKYNTAVKLTVVPCPPVVEVKIRRPDTKYQLGFSVQNGVICSLLRGGIAERGGVRVGHRIIDINSQSVVAVPHEKIVNLLATSVGEIRMKTMPTSIFRLLTGQETPQYI